MYISYNNTININTNINNFREYIKNKIIITKSQIPLNFINEYYKFYEMCETNVYGIPSPLVAIYLEYDNLKRFNEKLRTSFELNDDYIIVRKERKLEKNLPNTFYFLSFNGFEKACMLAKTKKGNEVRDYFILLRKFSDCYK